MDIRCIRHVEREGPLGGTSTEYELLVRTSANSCETVYKTFLECQDLFDRLQRKVKGFKAPASESREPVERENFLNATFQAVLQNKDILNSDLLTKFTGKLLQIDSPSSDIKSTSILDSSNEYDTLCEYDSDGPEDLFTHHEQERSVTGSIPLFDTDSPTYKETGMFRYPAPKKDEVNEDGEAKSEGRDQNNGNKPEKDKGVGSKQTKTEAAKYEKSFAVEIAAVLSSGGIRSDDLFSCSSQKTSDVMMPSERKTDSSHTPLLEPDVKETVKVEDMAEADVEGRKENPKFTHPLSNMEESPKSVRPLKSEVPKQEVGRREETVKVEDMAEVDVEGRKENPKFTDPLSNMEESPKSEVPKQEVGGREGTSSLNDPLSNVEAKKAVRKGKSVIPESHSKDGEEEETSLFEDPLSNFEDFAKSSRANTEIAETVSTADELESPLFNNPFLEATARPIRTTKPEAPDTSLKRHGKENPSFNTSASDFEETAKQPEICQTYLKEHTEVEQSVFKDPLSVSEEPARMRQDSKGFKEMKKASEVIDSLSQAYTDIRGCRGYTANPEIKSKPLIKEGARALIITERYSFRHPLCAVTKKEGNTKPKNPEESPRGDAYLAEGSFFCDDSEKSIKPSARTKPVVTEETKCTTGTAVRIKAVISDSEESERNAVKESSEPSGEVRKPAIRIKPVISKESERDTNLSEARKPAVGAKRVIPEESKGVTKLPEGTIKPAVRAKPVIPEESKGATKLSEETIKPVVRAKPVIPEESRGDTKLSEETIKPAVRAKHVIPEESRGDTKLAEETVKPAVRAKPVIPEESRGDTKLAEETVKPAVRAKPVIPEESRGATKSSEETVKPAVRAKPVISEESIGDTKVSEETVKPAVRAKPVISEESIGDTKVSEETVKPAVRTKAVISEESEGATKLSEGRKPPVRPRPVVSEKSEGADKFSEEARKPALRAKPVISEESRGATKLLEETVKPEVRMKSVISEESEGATKLPEGEKSAVRTKPVIPKDSKGTSKLSEEDRKIAVSAKSVISEGSNETTISEEPRKPTLRAKPIVSEKPPLQRKPRDLSDSVSISTNTSKKPVPAPRKSRSIDSACTVNPEMESENKSDFKGCKSGDTVESETTALSDPASEEEHLVTRAYVPKYRESSASKEMQAGSCKTKEEHEENHLERSTHANQASVRNIFEHFSASAITNYIEQEEKDAEADVQLF